MDEEFQKIMFQPFTRADDGRTTKVQGTGLGMAITKNIVNMMNGDIKVVSSLDNGTRISVTIYLKLQNKETDDIKELMNLPVLVVDDDIICCESTVETLKVKSAVSYISDFEKVLAEFARNRQCSKEFGKRRN